MPEWLLWTLFVGFVRFVIAAGYGVKYRDEKLVRLIEERQALQGCIDVIEWERRSLKKCISMIEMGRRNG